MEMLLTVKELATAIKVTEQTIQRYVLHKKIPFHKVMRMVRFRPSEINRWIDSGGLVDCVKQVPDENGETLFEGETDGGETAGNNV
jgi:excisionase family DNA binding protein